MTAMPSRVTVGTGSSLVLAGVHDDSWGPSQAAVAARDKKVHRVWDVIAERVQRSRKRELRILGMLQLLGLFHGVRRLHCSMFVEHRLCMDEG